MDKITERIEMLRLERQMLIERIASTGDSKTRRHAYKAIVRNYLTRRELGKYVGEKVTV